MDEPWGVAFQEKLEHLNRSLKVLEPWIQNPSDPANPDPKELDAWLMFEQNLSECREYVREHAPEWIGAASFRNRTKQE